MINYTAIRNSIVQGLRDYLRANGYEDILVIQANPDAPEPSRPFVTMNVISLFIPEPGHPSLTLEDDTAVTVEETRTSLDHMITSFNFYDDSSEGSRELALKAHEYFDYYGRQELRKDNIVVAELHSIENRDALVVDSWDRKNGFDVRFRLLSKLTSTKDIIETVEAEGTTN